MTWNTILFDENGMIKDASVNPPEGTYTSTFNSISLIEALASTEDPNHDAIVGVEYRKFGSSTWLNAMPLFRCDWLYWYGNGRPYAAVNAADWEPDTAYSTSDYCVNDGDKLYQATAGGTSASSGGPTGTGTGITDNTVTWNYVSASYRSERQNEFAGSIMYLTPGTQYIIRLTYTPGTGDPKSSLSQSFFSAYTKALPVEPTGNVYYCEAGSGTGNAGTVGDPFQGIAEAAAAVSPNDIVYLTSDAGKFDDAALTISGDPDLGYIMFAAKPGDSPKVQQLDIQGDYLWFRGLAFEGDTTNYPDRQPSTAYALNDQVKGTAANEGEVYVCVQAGTTGTGAGPSGTGTGIVDGGVIWDFDYFDSSDPEASWTHMAAIRNSNNGANPTNIVIEGCSTSNFGSGILHFYEATRWYVLDNNFVGPYPVDIAGTGSPGSSSARGCLIEGSNHVIAYNTITRYDDGIGVMTDSDCFGNYCYDNQDDNMESDYSGQNVRIWGNKLSYCAGSNSSFQPQIKGPWYFLYNQMADAFNGNWKPRVLDRLCFIGNTWRYAGYTKWYYFWGTFSRNNLYLGSGTLWQSSDDFAGSPNFRMPMPSPYTPDWRADWNYDGVGYTVNFFSVNNNSVYYSQLSDMYAQLGLEQNVVQVGDGDTIFETYSTGNQYQTMAPATDLTLKTGTNAAVGAGILVDNVADWHGATPDLGCLQRGDTPPQYGQRAAQLGTALASRTYDWEKH